MTLQKTLAQRSDLKCELCSSDKELSVYLLPPENQKTATHAILVCDTCHAQISVPDTMDSDHWYCLKSSMWSSEAPVQIMAWRILKCLSTETWASDLLDMLYLEPDAQSWAESSLLKKNNSDNPLTIDNNGTTLQAGDTVTLIKDLDVKGAGFIAKRGTVVKNIVLTDNIKHIEGRVNGVRIVLVANFLKKVTA